MFKIDLPRPLVVILGPTASGKSSLAVDLAEKIGHAEIVSADSRLFYRGMDIGTAKPSLLERRGIPHHLIDVASPDESWSLSQFKQAVQQIINNLHKRNILPILVGGTGQYLRAILQDWQPSMRSSSPHLRLALEHFAKKVGEKRLHSLLTKWDPQAALQIDYRNVRRTIRAWEIIMSTGKLASEQRRMGGCQYSRIEIGIQVPRDILYKRIDERIDAMIKKGFLNEVKSLIEEGYSAELPAFSAIGYREMIACVQGSMTLDQAIQQIKRKTRTFVRRQSNWFKIKDPEIHWLDYQSNLLESAYLCITNQKEWLPPQKEVGI